MAKKQFVKNCVICNVEFLGWRPDSQYCSNECRSLGHRVPTKPCAYCGVQFKGQSQKKAKYCSEQCVADAMRGVPKSEEHRKKISLAGMGKFAELHSTWKGDAAGYHAKHVWLRNNFGNPQKCEQCGIQGYKRDNGLWTIEWANISGEYRRDRDDYMGLCISCHRKRDAIKRREMKKNNSVAD